MSSTPRRSVLPRVPLPARLFISYLLVLALGAVPTFLYVRNHLAGDLEDAAALRLGESVQRAAALLAARPDGERLTTARVFVEILPERLTLIAPNGTVLLDSDARATTNHLGRPEVAEALDAAPLSHIAFARRSSETTGRPTLYAATRLSSSGAVVRLARPLDDVTEPMADLKAFARNVQAIAVSAAFLLSLLAAVLFVRPLQRVAATARLLADGDLSARTRVGSDDEVGDVARAIDEMAVDVRRRLANAGSGDAVVAQLIDALPVPVVIFDAGGIVVALNSPARTALHIDGPDVGRRMKHVFESGRFQRALAEAEADGDPEPLVVELDGGARVEGSVHLLKRPGAAPLTVLLGASPPVSVATTIPPVEAVRAAPLGELLQRAHESAGDVLRSAGASWQVEGPTDVVVADAEARVVRAIARVLEACATTTHGRAVQLHIEVRSEATRVALAFDASPTARVLDDVRALLVPLGGDVGGDGKEAVLWLPRA